MKERWVEEGMVAVDSPMFSSSREEQGEGRKALMVIEHMDPPAEVSKPRNHQVIYLSIYPISQGANFPAPEPLIKKFSQLIS